MKKMITVSSTLIVLNFYFLEIFAQCSDAGVCQVGHLVENDKENVFDISTFYKYGYSGKDGDVSFHSFQVNALYSLFSNSSIELAIPYNIQSGPAGDVNGIGDLLISWTQKFLLDETSSLNASLGVKLATGDDNKDHLPQVYQSGLGTNDVLFALNYTYDKISLGAGYQLSGGRNDNESIRLKRGDDLLIRGSYLFSFEDFSIIPQLLFIKRLSKSSILDLNSTEERFIDVDKSDQSQLNLLVQFQYEMGSNFTFIADAAIPFIKRNVNVDGLTRAYTFSLGGRYDL